MKALQAIQAQQGRTLYTDWPPGPHVPEAAEARIVEVKPDEVRLALPGSPRAATSASTQLITAPIGALQEVHVYNRQAGAAEGMAIGFLTAVLGGFALTFLRYEEPENNNSWGGVKLDRNAMAVLGGLVFGVIGAPVGGIVGVVRGHRTQYDFQP